MIHVKLKPKEGWTSFSRSKELIDYSFNLSQKEGWHYIGPTANTMVIEAPESGNYIYLEIAGESVADVVLSKDQNPGKDFEQACKHIMCEFQILESE